MTLEVKVSKKLVPYKLAYRELKKRVDSIKKHKSKDLLWILEHPLTYTCGIRSNEKEVLDKKIKLIKTNSCLLYTSPSPRDGLLSRMPSSA